MLCFYHKLFCDALRLKSGAIKFEFEQRKVKDAYFVARAHFLVLNLVANSTDFW